MSRIQDDCLSGRYIITCGTLSTHKRADTVIACTGRVFIDRLRRKWRTGLRGRSIRSRQAGVLLYYDINSM